MLCSCLIGGFIVSSRPGICFQSFSVYLTSFSFFWICRIRLRSSLWLTSRKAVLRRISAWPNFWAVPGPSEKKHCLCTKRIAPSRHRVTEQRIRLLKWAHITLACHASCSFLPFITQSQFRCLVTRGELTTISLVTHRMKHRVPNFTVYIPRIKL